MVLPAPIAYIFGNKESVMTDIALHDPDDRPMGQALRRGWRCRCPACGEGKLLQGYLKVRDNCPKCGEALHHQRADDGPAYLTIMIVGHILAPVLLFVYMKWRLEPMTMIWVFGLGCVALSLFLLPRMKGIMVAIQWSKRMHGFGHQPEPVSD
ncbi:zinc-finger protein [Gemmobacter tilapiae]|jgi:uncharacterized protein (DUF983 family)|uniref:Zinc-finger protein n=2 Tax=Neogemmobacter tilapiae TaxID=875041 RepID=A0A918TS79_9RHOB|nr:zinc-finger protein [Gemmobacter tilapiae]